MDVHGIRRFFFIEVVLEVLEQSLHQDAAILIIMGFWRRTPSFWRHAYTANVVMMTAGFVLIGYQLTGWVVA